jgi:hypothetical protein
VVSVTKGKVNGIESIVQSDILLVGVYDVGELDVTRVCLLLENRKHSLKFI